MHQARPSKLLSGYVRTLGGTKKGIVLNEDFFTSLVGLATDLGKLFAPVKPDNSFRQHLSEDLLTQAQARPSQPDEDGHRALLWGAILGSLLSLVGVTLCLLFRRENRRTVEARR